MFPNLLNDLFQNLVIPCGFIVGPTCLHPQGFGSGDFVKEVEATDVIGDIQGRWIKFDLAGKADAHLGFSFGFSKTCFF